MDIEAELHFQMTFTGQKAFIEFEGTPRIEMELHSKWQSDFAHVQKINVHPGQTIKIELPELGLQEFITVNEDQRFFSINLREGRLIVETMDRSRGYV